MCSSVAEVPSLLPRALDQCFHLSACSPYQVHHRIVESLLQLVEAERGGEAVNRYLLKHAVDMLSNLRLYEDGVQDTLLQSASQYYTRESHALINVGTCGQGTGAGWRGCCNEAGADMRRLGDSSGNGACVQGIEFSGMRPDTLTPARQSRFKEVCNCFYT